MKTHSTHNETNVINKIINGNSGRIRIFVIVLSVLIALFISLWAVIIIDYFKIDIDFGFDWSSITSIFNREDDGQDDISPPPGSDSDTDADGDIAATTPPDTPPPARTPVIPPDNSEVPLTITEISMHEYYPDIADELDRLASRFNSAAVSLVLFDGKTGEYFIYCYGYADKAEEREVTGDTKFYIASLTKPMTAACVMTLVDGGFIDLDTNVTNYFGYECANPNYPDTPITARMFLQHTSSVFDSGAYQLSRDRGSSESVRYLVERGSSFRQNRPGNRYEYSNFGFAILGSMCERVSGMTLDSMAREAIFNKLGIDAAYVPSKLQDIENIAVLYDNDHGVSRSVQSQLDVIQSDTPGHDLHLAHAGLTISAFDYAKFLSLFVNNGVFCETRVLSGESVSDFNNADFECTGYYQGLATRYSAGGFIGNDGYYWHTGSGYGVYSQYLYSTQSKRGVVVITTGASVNRLENGMIDACVELARDAWKVFDLPPDISDNNDNDDDDGSVG